MNILWKYTLKYLLKNKIRTLVTVIGIMLSVSLFTAVAEGFVSGRKYVENIVAATTGSYEAVVREVDGKQLKDIESMDYVTGLETVKYLGFAEIGSDNSGKPYLSVGEISGGFDKLAAINITEGRMPENEHEILLPLHLYTNGSVHYNPGDKLDLKLGWRIYEGKEIEQDSAHIENEELVLYDEKEYTVVGTYERFGWDLEPYSYPGYVALTARSADSDSVPSGEAENADFASEEKGRYTGRSTVLLTFESLGSIDDFEQFLITKYPEFSEGRYSTNSRLLVTKGRINDVGLAVMIYGLLGILFALIITGSIMLIYNSFSISVSERTKQFGLLKSVGATRRQIMLTIMYEVLILCAVAVPLGLAVGCIGLGITLRLLAGAFSSLAINYYNGMTISLYIEPVVLLMVSALGVVTTLASAMLPAVRMIRLHPIEAIRQSADIKIRKWDTRTLGITGKMFGFEGMIASKNFRRSRKKYRTTVVSMSVSIVLFVSAISFEYYVNYSMDTVTASEPEYDMEYIVMENEDYEKANNIISTLSGVYGCEVVNHSIAYILLDREQASDYYKQFFEDGTDVIKEPSININCIDDETFESLARDNNIICDADYGQGDMPVCILSDDNTVRETEDGSSKWTDVSMFRHDSFPMTVKQKKIKQDEIEQDEIKQNKIEQDEIEQNEIKQTEDGEADSYEIYEHTVAGCLDKRSAGITTGTTLIYRRSDIEKVYSDSADSFETSIFFNAKDYSAVAKKVENLSENGRLPRGRLVDYRSDAESTRAFSTIIKVFIYGFIVLMSLIAVANVFNTVSTNVFLRRREFAMLKSVGLSERGMGKMMNCECMLYGIKGLLYGVLLAMGMSYLIYRSIGRSMEIGFFMPWKGILISAAGVFAIIFITMLYSKGKLQEDNIIDVLKKENV